MRAYSLGRMLKVELASRESSNPVVDSRNLGLELLLASDSLGTRPGKDKETATLVDKEVESLGLLSLV